MSWDTVHWIVLGTIPLVIVVQFLCYSMGWRPSPEGSWLPIGWTVFLALVLGTVIVGSCINSDSYKDPNERFLEDCRPGRC